MPTLTELPASLETLKANLAALAVRNRAYAQRVGQAPPLENANFFAADDGAPTGTLNGVALASKRRPLDEAQRLTDQLDLREHGGIVILGIGMGHHIARMIERCDDLSTLIVFEPDLALVRAVLERVDLAEPLKTGTALFLDDPEDAAAISSGIQGVEGQLALGVQIIEHPASKQRLADTSPIFLKTLSSVLAAMRTTLITTLVQTDTTLRNEFMNARHYLECPGIDDLKGIASGHAAVIVSAGPSLWRNIDLLADPEIRERIVVIAVQTVLKPMLSKGIRPDFVVALDHHEISGRFYEGLTPEMVQGITLVAEGKSNARITDGFPGALRMPRVESLERVLARELRSGTPTIDREGIRPGATVAHLAYYLARHLGCNPAILIGQDLGFTDGQYYSKGAAIHDVWAPELNEFATLETLEWQRIVRGRNLLIRAEDHLARPVYTDAQMATYLNQFERDFAADAQKGLLTLDCTEGGVRKRDTVAQPLATALRDHAGPLTLPLPAFPAPTRADDTKLIDRAAQRLRTLRDEVKSIAKQSRTTNELLTKAAKAKGNNTKINKLITRIHEIRDEVESMELSFSLVQMMNQAGKLRRYRRDRLLRIDDLEGLDPTERQSRQIERDADNVQWLADVADALATLLDHAANALEGAPKLTRDPDYGEELLTSTKRTKHLQQGVAVLTVEFSSTNSPNHTNPDDDFLGEPIIRRTMRRIAQCDNIREALLLTNDAQRLTHALGELPLRWKALPLPSPTPGRADRIRRARAFATDCWRGGLGGATIFDEALDPAQLVAALDNNPSAQSTKQPFDDTVIAPISPYWALLDPALLDAVLEQVGHSTRGVQVAFSQAAPGLGALALRGNTIRDLAQAGAQGSVLDTIGGLLGYVPTAPRADPIAHRSCITIHPSARDAGARCIPDSPASTALLNAALTPAQAENADAQTIGAAVRAARTTLLPAGPAELIIEPLGGVPTNNAPRAQWWNATPNRAPMTPDHASALATQALALNPNLRTTLLGRGGRNAIGDPITHPAAADLIAALRTATTLHLRTDLTPGALSPTLLDAIATCDIVSADILAQDPAVYAQITGFNDLEAVRDAAKSVYTALCHDAPHGASTTRWLVGRITRCDAAYEQIEPFYDTWLLATAAAVIDPLPAALPDERIAPLGLPSLAQESHDNTTMLILSDGAVPLEPTDLIGSTSVANALEVGVQSAWHALIQARRGAGQ